MDVLLQEENVNHSRTGELDVLLKAVRTRDLERVKFLVESGNQRDSHLNSALMTAANYGSLEIVNYLISAGADIHAKDWNYETALMHASSKGKNLDVICLRGTSNINKMVSHAHKLRIIQILIECGADVHASNIFGDTALMFASKNDNVDIVAFLIKKGADANAANKQGDTSLIYAAERGNKGIVRCLIHADANVNSVGKNNWTSLLHAVKNGHLDIVQFLLEKSADIDAAEKENGWTSLMLAARKNDLDAVRLLVDNNNANVNAEDNLKMTSLMHAIVKNNLEIAKFLIKRSANVRAVDNGGSTALIYAARNTDVDIIQRLIKAGSDVNAVNARGETSLTNASKRGDLSIVRVLVESEANIDATDFKNRSPFIVAAGSGNVDLVRFLWKSGADISRLKDNIRMLLLAAESGNLEGVRQLGEDCDVNTMTVVERTLLMYAAELGAMEIVKILVENGADVNATDRHNCTTLLHAAKSRNWDVVRFLVSRGANVNISMDDGSTCLLYAARRNREDVVQFLVEAGADVNASDSNNRTPLLEAAHEGNLTVVTLVVNNGADVNYIGIDGQTALMHAAAKGNLPVVRFLTQSGAEINIVDKTGWTTLMHATQSGNFDVVQYLLNAGADQFMGSGNIGGEYRALWLDAEVAVKLFVPEASVTTFAHEVSVWHRLRHPNVIKLYGACDIGHNFFVCEWASNGSLFEYLSACEKRGERKTPWKFLHEAALGLSYLHERKIVHGNLCSNSILVGADEKVKLADFHVSGSAALFSGGRSDMGYGSFCWQAPELLKGEAASLASDIYSFCLCVMAAVSGETPWEGCLDVLKETWDPRIDPRYCAPVSMTVDLTTLASQMCGNDPHSRISASAVVRELESLALQESNEQQQSQLKLELIAHASECKDGELLRLWQKLQDIVSTVAADLPQLAVFRELKMLYNCLSSEKRPIVLLDQFYELVADCIGAIDVSSDQYLILRLSSTKAQGRSMTGIYRRIDALWDAIGNVHSDERKHRREIQRLEQREAFISELSQTIIVLGKLETDEARNTIVAFLKSEIDSHGSTYTEAQLTILEKAYTDLNASRQSDVVANVPKWFLPRYELEIDGANFLAEGAFGEVYRAKWLESEVVVKQVKFTNSGKSDSGISHSLSAALPTVINTSSVEKSRKEKREMFEHEVGIWFGLSHPHVVRLFGACHIGTPLFAYEYASNGSLDKYLRQHPNEIWSKLHEAVLGVQYLHSRDIIHGDLKCNNIVVGRDHKAKVTDFGLSSANVVTGAWQWVAPECLERGPSELSSASDIYALGMCIVEALRIVELTTSNKNDCVSLPWGNFENNVVKYHVTREKLPTRPKLCTDDEWGLVKLMCAYNPKDRIKVSTVVDKLAALAGVNQADYPEMAESVKLSQEEVEKMKRCCDLKTSDQREESTTNQVVLHSVYGLLWDRFHELCVMNNAEFGCLQRHFDRARLITRQLNQCPNTLPDFTEMVMNGYALHRELDKAIDANFWCVDRTSGGLHDWKSKCTTAVCIPALVSTRQEVTDTERKPKRMRYQ